MKSSGWKVFGCVILTALFLPAIGGFGQETETNPPATLPQSPPSKLIEMNGNVRFSGERALEMKSGWAMFLRPGQRVELEVTPAKESPLGTEIDIPQGLDQAKTYLARRGHTFRWEISAGAVDKFLPSGVMWKAPQKAGTCKISSLLTDEAAFSRIQPDKKILAERNILGTFVFHFLVMYPFDRDGPGVIEGYPIGIYPNEESEEARDPVASHRKAYTPPEYFVKITPEIAAVPISEHFTLGDFSPESDKDKIHFIALDPSLVQKLEELIRGLQGKGIELNGLKILRGYLSPNEVERLKRKGIDVATFSRSIYGDSAIFIIDEDDDGIMDDLNSDGAVNRADMAIVAEVVESLEDKNRNYGGLGIYFQFKDPVHKDTPCFQIDSRGWRSRWGMDLYETEEEEESPQAEEKTGGEHEN